jgi:hypothetical protein
VLHVFIDGQKTSTRPFFAPLFAGVSWPRALPRLLQIDVSTSTTVDRSSIPDQRNPWPGRPPVRSIVAVRSRAAAEGTQGQGSRSTEPSTLTPGIALENDFAPALIASGTSCRGHCLPPCPEKTRAAGEAASAGHASKACAAGGPCDARSPRRDRALTSPRGLPSQGRSKTGQALRSA